MRVTDLKVLPSCWPIAGHPELVDAIGQQQHLHALGAIAFQLRLSAQQLRACRR